MKKRNILKLIIYSTLFSFINVQAQDEIIFAPSELEPHEDGYYNVGVDVDENEDGVLEHHEGCEDYYEDEDLSDGYNPQLNHQESGTQQDFQYIKCMIMPDCAPKGTPIDPPVANGYIQMSPSLYLGTDSASISAIITPPLKNIVSITMETSSDVSINDKRKIPYNIHYSKDYGATWVEDVYINDYVATQGGYRVTYENGHSLEFEFMITESKESPVLIRFSTSDFSIKPPLRGQFVKVHYIKIIADKKVVGYNAPQKDINIIIHQKNIISEKENISVYNYTGQLIGKGKEIQVPSSGIYLVISENYNVRKIFIK